MRHSAEIEEAENGHIVRVSCDGKNGYESKRFVATTLPQAQRIAGAALSGKIKVGKKGRRRGRGISEATATPKKRVARKRRA